MGEVWYRYYDVCYAAPVDEYGDVIRGAKGDRKVHLVELDVIKRTPKGVWLHDRYGRLRFVLESAKRRYACPTKKEAIISFLARKRRQKSIYEARASDAAAFVHLATQMLEDMSPPDMSHCHGGRDGECYWKHCPQLRDHEPAATGRHCPLDQLEEEA